LFVLFVIQIWNAIQRKFVIRTFLQSTDSVREVQHWYNLQTVIFLGAKG